MQYLQGVSQMAKNNSTVEKENNNQDLKAIEFEPIFTIEKMKKQEAKYNETWGVSRRCAMVTLARSKHELLEGFNNVNYDDSFFHLIEQLTDYRKHLEAGIELTNCAIARLFVVGEIIAFSTSK